MKMIIRRSNATSIDDRKLAMAKETGRRGSSIGDGKLAVTKEIEG